MDPFSNKLVIACLYCKSLYKMDRLHLGKPVKCGKCQRTFLVETPEINQSGTEDKSLFLCKLALNYGLLNEKQLEAALTEYASEKTKKPTSIESVLLRTGLMTEDNMQLLHDISDNWGIRLEEKTYAAIAVRKGLVSQKDAKNALIQQAVYFKTHRTIKPVSELLMESGLIKEDEHRSIKSGAKQADLRPLPSQPLTPEKPQLQKKEKPPAPEAPQPESITKQQPVESVKDTERIEKQPAVTQPEAQTPVEPEPEQKQPETPAEPVQQTASETTKEELPETPPIEVTPENEPVPPDILSPQTDFSPSGTDEPEQSTQVEETPAEPDDVSPDEVININGLDLIISEDKITALLRAPKDIDQSSATLEDIKAALKEQGIIFGVVENALIQGFLNSKIFREKPFKIAEGKRPIHGTSGSVKYHFDTDYLKIGAVTDSGNIDFKNRGEIPHVKSGDILAEITPAVQGKSGTDIYGNELLVPDITDIIIRVEKGAEYSEDRKKIYATTDGQPKLNFGDRLSVLSELLIPGDVGFETGHIDFQGNVVIKGTVQSDFRVKGATIKAKEVLSATIESTGDLEVKDGISGATITAQGNVRAKYIHKANITAFGDIIVQKEIIDSRLTNSGGCYIEKGKIITSEITAKQGIEALEIGTEMSSPCTLKIGVDDHIANEVEAIDSRLAENKEHLKEIRKKIDTSVEEEKDTHKNIADLAHVQDRSQLEMKDLKDALENAEKTANTEEIKTLEKRIETLDSTVRDADVSINNFFDRQDQLVDEIAKLRKQEEEIVDAIDLLKREKRDLVNWSKKVKAIPSVKVQKTLFSGTVVIGANTNRVIKDSARKVRIRELSSESSAEGWELRID